MIIKTYHLILNLPQKIELIITSKCMNVIASTRVKLEKFYMFKTLKSIKLKKLRDGCIYIKIFNFKIIKKLN
jgi:hypothetical protein